MTIDPRSLSQQAYQELVKLKEILSEKDRKKASGLIQGLPSYVATWGLYRLSGDAKKFTNGTAENTLYKGKVYYQFLSSLANKKLTGFDFDPKDEGALLNMASLRDYTALSHFAMQLAKEWSFWTASVLGEPEVE